MTKDHNSIMLQPSGWRPTVGYSNGIKTNGDLVFVAGQIGWDEQGNIVSSNLAKQTRRALENIVAVLKEGGAEPNHIVRMTWYVVDIAEYRSSRKDIGEAYRAIIGDHYPAMSLFEVSALLEEGAKIEIEATAAVPPRG